MRKNSYGSTSLFSALGYYPKDRIFWWEASGYRHWWISLSQGPRAFNPFGLIHKWWNWMCQMSNSKITWDTFISFWKEDLMHEYNRYDQVLTSFHTLRKLALQSLSGVNLDKAVTYSNLGIFPTFFAIAV